VTADIESSVKIEEFAQMVQELLEDYPGYEVVIGGSYDDREEIDCRVGTPEKKIYL